MTQGKGFTAQRPLRWGRIRLGSPHKTGVTERVVQPGPVKPREWFLVPLQVINEAVERIRDGSITKTVYDPETARLVGQA
jgi:hypothetical protein